MSSEVNFSSFGRSFQEKIIQALLTDHKWAESMSEVVNVNYFDLMYLKYLAERYFSYYQKYRAFPTMQLLITIVRDDLRVGNDLVLRDQIIDFLHRIKTNPDIGDLEFVKDKSFDFCKKQAFKEALEKSVDLINQDRFEEVVTVMKEAINVGTTPSIGHDFMNDMEARFMRLSRVCCPTGIEVLDKRDILNGGLGRGEIGVIVGGPGIGKSHFLTHLGAHALRVGKNVLHYTFELSEIAVGLRYDSNLTGISSSEVIDQKEEVTKRLKAQTLGRLIIKEYPTGSASVSTLRAHMNRLALKGFKPNVIVIDYADIMRSSRQFDSLRHELKLIYEELRNLSMELAIPVWTASQANRDAVNNDVVGLENMSEAYGKAMVADVVISLQRKALEKSSGLGRMYIAKNRAGKDGLLFPIKLDTATSMLSVISAEETASLELGSDENDWKKNLREKWREINKDKSFNLEKV